MAFDWSDLIFLAQQWNSNTLVDEATERAIISRSYYGAFNLARARLGGRVVGNDEIHKRVIVEYKSSKNQHERTVGNWLDSLRHRRVKADYEINFNPKGSGKIAIKEALKILSKLNSCP